MTENETHPYIKLLQELKNIEQLKEENPEQYQTLYEELLQSVQTYRDTLQGIVDMVDLKQ